MNVVIEARRLTDRHFSITRWKSVFTKTGFDAFIWAWQGSPVRRPFAALRFRRSNGLRWWKRCCASSSNLQTTNEQLQATVQQQQLRIEQLEEEIRRLKGLPEPPKRPPQPSPLNDPSGPPSASGERRSRTRPTENGPGPPNAPRRGTWSFMTTCRCRSTACPTAPKFLGYQDFTVQDLKVEPHNTRYRRGRYQLPDGTIVTAPLPKDVTSHFGPTLRQYVLYQHFHNHVTQPLLHEELLELGIDISAGQVNRLLTEGHEAFHQEKDSLLPAAREVSAYLQTDDTSAKHRGKGGHTLHIGNDLFASFFTTDTKSRVNFLKILLTPHQGYLFNGDALFYLECFELPQKLLAQLQTPTRAGSTRTTNPGKRNSMSGRSSRRNSGGC